MLEIGGNSNRGGSVALAAFRGRLIIPEQFTAPAFVHPDEAGCLHVPQLLRQTEWFAAFGAAE
ncbi:hypothetical protein [Bradyrhizobium sp. BR 1432]|uniref:hypothetical protein n=1 Tax=Bradyrhizobium sp. BR 1432 TaxID=3447966 RepID=UPI003EE4EABC